MTDWYETTHDEAKWDAVAAELLQRTRDGQLRWETDSRVQSAHSDRLTTPVYVAPFEDWRITVYGFEFKHWYEEDQFEWIDAVSVELIDEDGRSEWRLPQTAHAWRLLDTVRRQHAAADRFADEVLGGGTKSRGPQSA